MAILALLAVSSWAFPACAAESYTEDAVKAAYLYRFAGYVAWPERETMGAPFIIEVFGAPAVARELRRLLSQHSIHGRPAEVREIGNARDLGSAQILYVGSGHAGASRALTPTAGGSSVLVVTDEDGGLNSGAAINFLTIDRSIRFEVSLPNADRWGLKISADLLGVALRVLGGRQRTALACIPRQSETDPNPCPVDYGGHG